MQCEWLIFSSHKTATQTILNTIRQNGVRALHGHVPENIGLDHTGLLESARQYLREHKRRLRVVSVFREPLSRMVSSFFQSLQVHYYARTRKAAYATDADWLARSFDRTDEEMNALFADYIERIDGFGESLYDLAKAFSFSCSDIPFDVDSGTGLLCLPLIELHVFRFDQIIRDFTLVSQATGLTIQNWRNANVTDEKPFHARYRSFKDRFMLPESAIQDLYNRRRMLVDIFYPGSYAQLVENAIRQHAQPGPRP